MPQMIRMTHPGIPGAEPAVTSQDAYDRIWAGKGWVKAGDVLDPAAARAARRADQARQAPPAQRPTRATNTKGSDA